MAYLLNLKYIGAPVNSKSGSDVFVMESRSGLISSCQHKKRC